jgi:hypothetical protein
MATLLKFVEQDTPPIPLVAPANLQLLKCFSYTTIRLFSTPLKKHFQLGLPTAMLPVGLM